MRTDSTRASSATFAANRAQGAVRFGVHLQDGVTRRGSLHESGSLRVRFPSPEAEGLSGVFVNTAGGIAGGDRFDIDIAAGEGTRLTLTTAAAEKVYRAPGAAAHLGIALKAAAGAHLAWLPQETILFDRARIVRRIDIDLAEDASLLLCEIVVFGRAAMGEKCCMASSSTAGACAAAVAWCLRKPSGSTAISAKSWRGRPLRTAASPSAPR